MEDYGWPYSVSSRRGVVGTVTYLRLLCFVLDLSLQGVACTASRRKMNEEKGNSTLSSPMVCLCKTAAHICTHTHTHSRIPRRAAPHTRNAQPSWERTFTPPETTVTSISYSIPVTSISYGAPLTDRRSSLSKHRNEGKHNGDVSTTFLATHGRRHHRRRGCERRSPTLP